MKSHHEGIEKARQQLEKDADFMRMLVKAVNPNLLLPVCKIAVLTESAVPSRDLPGCFRFNADRCLNFTPEFLKVVAELKKRVRFD